MKKFTRTKAVLFTCALLLHFSLVLHPSVAISQAPAIDWQKNFGGGGEDQPGSITSTSDGGYITLGRSTSTNGDVTGNHGDFDMWVIKLNSLGEIEWQKSLGGSSLDVGNNSIKQTADGGYILIGSSRSSDGNVSYGHGFDDLWVVRIDALGNIMWEHTFGGTYNDYGTTVAETADGGFVVGGTTISTDGDITQPHGYYDAWIIKLTKNGDIVWQKTYGGSGDDAAWTIKQTKDNGYIVAGHTASNNGDVTINKGGVDCWLFKLSETGALQWQKTYGGSLNDSALGMNLTEDGGYIICGLTNSNNGDVTSNKGGSDVWLVKTSSTGTIEWQKTYGGSNNERGGFGVTQTADKGYLAIATGYSTDGDVTENKGNGDYWIIKVDPAGMLQWQKDLGGSGDEACADVTLSPDGGYILAGYSSSADGDLTGNKGGYDYWIVKLVGGTLPLKYTLFTGSLSAGNVYLSWKSENETLGSYYEVEKSSDGHTYTFLEKVKAGTGGDYQAIDANPNTTNFYRIKTVGPDGNVRYSKIVVINTKIAGELSIHPNPVTNYLFVQFKTDKSGRNTIKTLDYQGRVCQENMFESKPGLNSITLNTNNLTKGIYLIVLNGGLHNTSKFIKN